MLAQRRHSWPPAASKQTKASLSPAIFASSEWPSSVFGRRSWRWSLKQCRSIQSRETSIPMISGCATVFMLSSFWCAVLGGRNQLYETMKRGGAGYLESVVRPQGLLAMHRPVAGLGQGRRRERNITVEIQKGCNGYLTKNHETHAGSAGTSGSAVSLHVRGPNALGFPTSSSRQTEIVLRRTMPSTGREALTATCSDPSVDGHPGRAPRPDKASADQRA